MKLYRKLILNYRKLCEIHTFRCYCKLKTGNELLLVFLILKRLFEILTDFRYLKLFLKNLNFKKTVKFSKRSFLFSSKK